MSYVLDTITTDSYQELSCPGARSVTIQVSNAGASIGFGQGGDGRAGTATYGQDEPFLPVVAGLARACDAIRVKSYATGTPANVKVIAK